MDEKTGILFVNSAMDIENKAHRIRCVFDLKDGKGKGKGKGGFLQRLGF